MAEAILKSIGLRNFKAFYDLEDQDIRPLTVLVGKNSVGKSSLLQSLLLLKQTLEADRFTGRLKFDGSWTKLSGLSTILSGFNTDKTLDYRFSIEYPFRLLHGAELLKTPRRVDPSSTVTSHIYLSFGVDLDTSNAMLRELSVSTFIPSCMGPDAAASIRIRSDGTIFEHENLANTDVFGIDLSAVKSVTLDKFLPQSLLTTLRGDQGHKNRQQVTVPIQLLSGVSEPLALFQSILVRSIEYLGPIRANPLPFYPVEDTPGIGPSGEDTIPYLLLHQKDRVSYRLAPDGDEMDGTLLEATNGWLRRMDVTTQLTIKPIEDIAYVARIKSQSAAGNEVNLNQVGFGVSQLLPVLVMGLKQPGDGILLLEQPEIHLHPRMQAALAEFLLSVVKTGKRVIVETHSDHLINRLRRCVAEDATGEATELVKILFVHAGRDKDAGSYVEPLGLDMFGSIINWPPDFFTESAEETKAILEASLRRK